MRVVAVVDGPWLRVVRGGGIEAGVVGSASAVVMAVAVRRLRRHHRRAHHARAHHAGGHHAGGHHWVARVGTVMVTVTGWPGWLVRRADPVRTTPGVSGTGGSGHGTGSDRRVPSEEIEVII